MRVRPATADDAEAIERIRIRGWQVAYRHVFPAEELDRMPVDWSRWLEWFANTPAGFAAFVAEDAEGMLGWATVGPSGIPDRYGELHGLYVDPDRWGQGAGRDRKHSDGYADSPQMPAKSAFQNAFFGWRSLRQIRLHPIAKNASWMSARRS